MWDECAAEVYADYIVNDSIPVVAIFNLARIGFSIDGFYYHFSLSPLSIV